VNWPVFQPFERLCNPSDTLSIRYMQLNGTNTNLIMEAGFFVNIDFLTWNWNLGKFGHSALVRPGLDFFYGRIQSDNLSRASRREPPVESLWVERQGRAISINQVTCRAEATGPKACVSRQRSKTRRWNLSCRKERRRIIRAGH
jgi:hypothetical protein